MIIGCVGLGVNIMSAAIVGHNHDHDHGHDRGHSPGHELESGITNDPSV